MAVLPTRPWKLSVFGAIRVTDGVNVIDEFPTRRSALLLARLALSHDRTLTRSSAAESLWPEDYFDATRVRLRQELARLRRALGEAKDLLEVDGETIRLSAGATVDIDEYRQALRLATETSATSDRITHLQLAIQLSEPPLMSGADDAWVQAERNQVDRDRYSALLELSSYQRECGAFDAALKLARRAVAIDPTREGARLLVGQVLADLGYPADAMLELASIRRPEDSDGGGIAQRLQPLDLMPKAVRPLRFMTPFPAEAIYGREHELAEIRKQINPAPGNPRLVSLLGPGGIGKSRLLMEAATQLRDIYGGRVAYADLSELHDANLVPLAILRALRADSIPTDNPAERLSAVIPVEPTMFALDNVEQLGARMQVLVRRLLERHSELRIITTSRGALDVGGEHRVQVGPLPVPNASHKDSTQEASPAFRMFMELARANGAELTDDATARSIVRRLEGVPLAILLAAGRLRTLGADELDRQLEASFDILATGGARVAERHRSMRRVVEGSFNSLSPDVQRVLCALAVFRGGWTLAAATRVCQLEDALDAMESLLDSSLIYVDQEGRSIRFRMLESIRSYALTLVDDETLRSMRIAHAEWVGDLADSVAVEYATESDIQRFDALATEWDNVRGALDFALDEDPLRAYRLGAALSSYWCYRSNGFEAFRFYEELFDRYHDIAAGVDAAKAGFGQVLVLQMVEAGERVAEQDRAFSLCRNAGLNGLCAKLEAIRGTRAQNAQNYEVCATRFESAEALVGIDGNELDQAFISIQKGYCLYYQGRPSEAVAVLKPGVEALANRGELFHQLRGRQWLALASIDTGQLELADQALEGLLDAVRRAKFLPMLAPTYTVEGKLAFRHGRFQSALEWFSVSYEEWSERRVPWLIYEQEYWLGRSHLALKNYTQAEKLLRQAAVHWFDYRSYTAASTTVFTIAELLIATGRTDIAAMILGDAIRTIDSRNALILASERAHHRSVVAQLALKQVQLSGGETTLTEAIAACRAPGDFKLA